MKNLNRFDEGDSITHIDSTGPILDVLMVVEGQYVLRSPDGHKFLRPVAWVDNNFWLVVKP